jgi:cysteine desulfurase
VEVTYLPVDEFGRVSAASVASALGEDVILLSIMHANNETGVIQPVAEIGRLARERGIPFHVDAVQALGKIDVKVDELGADLVSVSAHKINGPKGTGALYIRRGTEIEPLAHGGDHEGGVRAGTENVAGIVGFGRAVELRQGAPADRERAAVEKMRDRLEAGVSAAMEGVSVNGHPRERVGNTSSISFAGVEAEAILVGLDLEGVAISSGSACTAGTTEPSHVLLAMGLEPRRAASAVRFSLGWGNTDAEIDRLIELLPPLVARLRRISTGA